jgi:Domain of unknown function (DUF3806)
MNYLKSLIAIALTCTIATTNAQTPLNVVSEPTVVAPPKDVIIKELGWMDKNKMEQEITELSELTKTKLGTPIRKDLSDLDTMQRLVDKNVVEQDDYETQQAMGLVLGNLILADFPNTFEWKIYEDEIGRSRALCVKKTSDCLFPITMLSRRMEVGTKPDVKKIHIDAIMRMEKHLPKLPYDGGIMYKFPR